MCSVMRTMKTESSDIYVVCSKVMTVESDHGYAVSNKWNLWNSKYFYVTYARLMN